MGSFRAVLIAATMSTGRPMACLMPVLVPPSPAKRSTTSPWWIVKRTASSRRLPLSVRYLERTYMMIEKLATTLRALLNVHPLTNYTWDLPDNCPIDIPSHVSGGYERNVYLKEHLHSVIRDDCLLESHYWVIQDWGRIRTFKKNQKNDVLIKKFLAELESGKLTRNSFGCISSLSKVASFLAPEQYAIYDSRAIYSLNWLLYNFAESYDLFPQPIGRSSELAKYDMQTIFRLARRQFSYRSSASAFHDYCNLLRELSVRIFGQGSKPYMVEMLLFMIAPTWVVCDIEKSVSLKITKDA